MAGDHVYWQLTYRGRSTDANILTSTDYTAGNGTAVVAVTSANHTLYIQRIVVSPTTYAAKTFTFQDDAGTPVPIALVSIPASAPTTGGVVPYVYEFGPHGVPLTQGKNLLLKMSATGAAAFVHIEGYERLTGIPSV